MKMLLQDTNIRMVNSGYTVSNHWQGKIRKHDRVCKISNNWQKQLILFDKQEKVQYI